MTAHPTFLSIGKAIEEGESRLCQPKPEKTAEKTATRRGVRKQRPVLQVLRVNGSELLLQTQATCWGTGSACSQKVVWAGLPRACRTAGCRSFRMMSLSHVLAEPTPSALSTCARAKLSFSASVTGSGPSLAQNHNPCRGLRLPCSLFPR